MIILRAVIVYPTITTVITPSPLTAESRPSAHTLEKVLRPNKARRDF